MANNAAGGHIIVLVFVNDPVEIGVDATFEDLEMKSEVRIWMQHILPSVVRHR